MPQGGGNNFNSDRCQNKDTTAKFIRRKLKCPNLEDGMNMRRGRWEWKEEAAAEKEDRNMEICSVIRLQHVRYNMKFCSMNSIRFWQWCIALCRYSLSGFYWPPFTHKGTRRFETWICVCPKVVGWRGTKSVGMFSATSPSRTGTSRFPNRRVSFPNAVCSPVHKRSNFKWDSLLNHNKGGEFV